MTSASARNCGQVKVKKILVIKKRGSVVYWNDSVPWERQPSCLRYRRPIFRWPSESLRCEDRAQLEFIRDLLSRRTCSDSDVIYQRQRVRIRPHTARQVVRN